MLSIILMYVLLTSFHLEGNCYRILMLPLNVNSHIMFIGRLGSGLSKLGHQVTMPVPSNAENPFHLASENFTISPYQVEGSEPFFNTREASEKYLDYALAENKLFEYFELGRWFISDSADAMNRDCESLLESRELMDSLINQTKFDFAIVDFLLVECVYAMVKMLNVPFGVMTIPVLPWNSGVPRFSSFAPPYSLELSDKMNFPERLLALLTDLTTYAGMRAASNPSRIPEYLPYRSSGRYNMLEAVKNASLLFYLEDLTVSYPRPGMPDVISVGDVSAGIPVKSLPADMDTFMSDSEAVVVSFGSYFQYLRENLAVKFCEAFAKLDTLKIVWKMKNESLCGPNLSNVMIRKWLPQNDLLADRRVKILITHGGFNSIIESIYHGKPVIIFPLAADQPSQAKLTVERGFGKSIDLRYWTPEELASSVRELLSDSSYRKAAERSADILRSRNDTPAQRASTAIDHVMRFGTSHLRSSARDLHWTQFMMFDLVLTLSVIVAGALYLFWWVLIMLSRLLGKIVSKGKIKNE